LFDQETSATDGATPSGGETQGSAEKPGQGVSNGDPLVASINHGNTLGWWHQGFFGSFLRGHHAGWNLASKFSHHHASGPLSLWHLHHAGLGGGTPLFHDLTNLGWLANWLHRGQSLFGSAHGAKTTSETTGIAGQPTPAQGSGRLDLIDILKHNGLIPPSSS
jgi:hypothetical protein